jgi:putative protease
LAGVFNTRAVDFFARLGIGRITFPRELAASEMAVLARSRPAHTFDAFILFGACPNMESFCRWAHDDPGRVWPCVKEYTPADIEHAGEKTWAAAAALAGWGGLPRAWACGLCALFDLNDVPNIEGLKIVGRGAPHRRNLAGVKTIRGLLDILETGVERRPFMELARSRKRTISDTGCLPYLCYYPEYL